MLAKEVISGVIREAFSSKRNADTLLLHAGLDANLLRGTAPVDDEVPPNGVTGLTATPIYAGVRLQWSEPPAEDFVRSVRVEITPQGDPTEVRVFPERMSVTIFDLDAKPHTFRVMLVDEWGLESAWSTQVTATPVTTADSDIDLAYKQTQGTLQGLIEAINLAGPTAEAGIQGVALAATQANNMLPLIESDVEMWNTTSEWPPPDARLADGTRIISSNEPAGHTLDLTRQDGYWKIRHTRATPSTDFVWPVTQWREERRVSTGNFYMAQVTVSGPSGAVVSIAVEAASDAAGSNMAVANNAQFTLGGGTQKIYVGFTGDDAKPYVRFRLGLHTDDTTVYWYKFMLEQARQGATEPSPWSAGVLATGSVAAHTLTALTANVAQAVIAEAAIQTGMIAELKADKIITGDLNANIIIANGELRSEGAVMDNRGLYLVSQELNPEGGAGANGFPSMSSVGDWITSNPDAGRAPNPYAGLGFFYDSTDKRRGILIRARGEFDTNVDGYISIGTTSAGTNLNAETSAFVTLRAGRPGERGTVIIGQHLKVSGLVELPNGAINASEIASVYAEDIIKRGDGFTFNAGWLPNLAGHSGDLPWSRINGRPDMTKYVTGSELQNKGYKDAAGVRSIVKDMVKSGALR